jgi:hypothetical protein
MPTELTQTRLKELLNYDPETGEFRWRVPRQGINADRVAGTVIPTGYRKIMVDYRLYMAHRLAWLYVHGAWPSGEIDHINGDADDNRIGMLREATRSQNARNLKKRADNTSGFPGVCWDEERQLWMAYVGDKGRTKYIGRFPTREAARDARQKAARDAYGAFFRAA